MNSPESLSSFRVPCKYLRTNNMYYSDVGSEDAASPDSVYWCTKTHETFGPDGEPASKSECCTGRKCHVT